MTIYSNKKFNQKKNRTIKSLGQTDEQENVELAQMLRNLYPHLKITRESFILFMPDGKFLRTQKHEPTKEERDAIAPGIQYRHPDFMIFEKLTGNKKGKLLCCMENDGSIHRIKWAGTEERNKQYDTAEVPLLVINKERMTVSAFDEANRLLGEFLKC